VGEARRAAIFSGNSFTELGGSGSFAFGINNAGQVVGYELGVHQRAFLYSGGTVQDLGALDGGQSSAFAINAKGHVTGMSSNGASVDKNVAFFYDGTMHSLGNLGGTGRGEAINSSDVVVGESELTINSNPIHAFIYSNGPMQDLNNLIPAGSGWTLEYALGINDAGQIVGRGTYQGQPDQAYLLTPTPEPMGLGITAVAGAMLFRRNRQARSRGHT
jgi:probable HAF family extracellular repeat protein